MGSIQQRDRDEVRVMTVHGAKGLEAPIVFLPDTVHVDRGRDSLLWDASSEVVLPLWPRRKREEDAISAQARAEAIARAEDEHRRLLYVAMTRAQDRLIVCGWRSQDEPKQGSWYNRIAGAAECLTVPVETLSSGVRRWSSPQVSLPDRPGTADGEEVVPPLPIWFSQKALADEHQKRLMWPSLLNESGSSTRSSGLVDAAGSGALRGTLIHRLLQFLPEVSESERPVTAKQFLAVNAASVAEDERYEIAENALAVLSDSTYAPIFGPGSRAEVSVIGKLGSSMSVGRIDRLLVTDHEVLIVDYKTQRPAPTDISMVPEAYLHQLAAYRGALSNIYPDRPVRCALLWTDGPRWMDLSESALPKSSP